MSEEQPIVYITPTEGVKGLPASGHLILEKADGTILVGVDEMIGRGRGKPRIKVVRVYTIPASSYNCYYVESEDQSTEDTAAKVDVEEISEPVIEATPEASKVVIAENAPELSVEATEPVEEVEATTAPAPKQRRRRRRTTAPTVQGPEATKPPSVDPTFKPQHNADKPTMGTTDTEPPAWMPTKEDLGDWGI